VEAAGKLLDSHLFSQTVTKTTPGAPAYDPASFTKVSGCTLLVNAIQETFNRGHGQEN